MSETWEQAVGRAMSEAPPEVWEEWRRLRAGELQQARARPEVVTPAGEPKALTMDRLVELYLDLWRLMVEQRERAERAEATAKELSDRVGTEVSLIGATPEVVRFVEKAREREAARWKVLEAAETLAGMLFVDGIVRERTIASMSLDVQDCVWRVVEAAFESMALAGAAAEVKPS